MHQNASFYSKNLKNFLEREHNPLLRPYLQCEGGHPLPTPYLSRGLPPSVARPPTFKPCMVALLDTFCVHKEADLCLSYFI